MVNGKEKQWLIINVKRGWILNFYCVEIEFTNKHYNLKKPSSAKPVKH